ncbi:polysaccharide biosynthesis/export family protein [Methylomonas sp. MgM2]
MKIFSLFLAVTRYRAVAVMLLFGIFVAPSFAIDESYRINKGDKLKINVWQEENLQSEVAVSPDGTISFPMVGIVQAAGKTIEEFQNLLRERLEEYIPGPEVNVTLLSADGNLIYVIGEVARPGPYPMNKNLDVMQALSMAGGFTPFAAKNDIRILRHDLEGHSKTIPFAYGDIEDGDALDTNILLQSGDTIIVP